MSLSQILAGQQLQVFWPHLQEELVVRICSLQIGQIAETLEGHVPGLNIREEHAVVCLRLISCMQAQFLISFCDVKPLEEGLQLLAIANRHSSIGSSSV